jgi:glycerophosphoryl diester phosphodiesterase
VTRRVPLSRALLALLALVVALSACSSSSAGSGPDAGSDVPATDLASADAAGGPDVVAEDPSPAPDLPDAPPDAGAPADVPPEAGAEVVVKPIPPVVPGPPAHLYDCTHDPATLPGHVSPVPLGCVVDPACTGKMVTAHRGAGGDFGTIAPQNSLSAVRAGIVMGVDAVEIDVRQTLDGRFVLMHDASVDRTTDGTGDVSALTLADIRALRLKSDNLLSGGDFSCDVVPTLEEVLDLTRDRVWIYLDAKTDAVADVVALVAARGMLDQVVVASGDTSKALAARAANPGARVLVWLGSFDAIEQALVDVVPPPDIIEVQPPHAKAAADLLHPLGVKVAVDAFAMDMTLYLDDDPSGFDDLFAAGIDSVQVEYPPLLLRHLDRYPFP